MMPRKSIGTAQLNDFSIFDPLRWCRLLRSKRMIIDGVDRPFEGDGWVTAYFRCGQEEGEEEEEEEKIGAILRYTLDYRSDYE